MTWFTKKKKMEYITLDENAFNLLVNGDIVVTKYTKFALQDIGFKQMLEAIYKASARFSHRYPGIDTLENICLGLSIQKPLDELRLMISDYINTGKMLDGMLGSSSIDPVFRGGFEQGLRVAIGMIDTLKKYGELP